VTGFATVSASKATKQNTRPSSAFRRTWTCAAGSVVVARFCDGKQICSIYIFIYCYFSVCCPRTL